LFQVASPKFFMNEIEIALKW